jgi:phosphopantothenoylcysteine decarboxylase / phosphopantothenate---cysteine ligase
MRILVTAGPTREFLDSVRFLTNASSGRMGYAVARAASRAGHEVTLLSGPVSLAPPPDCEVVRFVSVADLHSALDARFDTCDALVMTAAVGDFRPERTWEGKLSRAAGAVELRLIPTEDVLASVAERKDPEQIVVAFAVEDGPDEQIVAKARAEMVAKHADYVVVNTPLAMGATASRACVLEPQTVALDWAQRPKTKLATSLVDILEHHETRL